MAKQEIQMKDSIQTIHLKCSFPNRQHAPIANNQSVASPTTLLPSEEAWLSQHLPQTQLPRPPCLLRAHSTQHSRHRCRIRLAGGGLTACPPLHLMSSRLIECDQTGPQSLHLRVLIRHGDLQRPPHCIQRRSWWVHRRAGLSCGPGDSGEEAPVPTPQAMSSPATPATWAKPKQTPLKVEMGPELPTAAVELGWRSLRT